MTDASPQILKRAHGGSFVGKGYNTVHSSRVPRVIGQGGGGGWGGGGGGGRLGDPKEGGAIKHNVPRWPFCTSNSYGDLAGIVWRQTLTNLSFKNRKK